MLLPHETEIVARLLYETRQSARKILDLPTHPLTWDELDGTEQKVYARMAEAMEQHVSARAALAKRWLARDSALGFLVGRRLMVDGGRGARPFCSCAAQLTARHGALVCGSHSYLTRPENCLGEPPGDC